MPTDNIDDLFRDQLDGHATPPGDELWARLAGLSAAAPAAKQPDEFFRHQLATHITPPRRELWERLEDEHLRPRQRRAAAWWPMALAAALVLLLVAGGTRLWLGYSGPRAIATLGSGRPSPVARATALPQTGPTKLLKPATAETVLAMNAQAGKTTRPGQAARLTTRKHVNSTSQATGAGLVASTPSKAASTPLGPRRSPLKETTPQPDAVAAQSPQRARPARLPGGTTAADEPRQPADPIPSVIVASAAVPTEAPAPTATTMATAGLITVDVRQGFAPAARPALSTAARAAGAHQRLGARLLQQAGHVLRGESLDLAEMTGLPDKVTVQATVGRRSFTKSIQF